MARKSKLMLQTEERYKEPLETLLPRMVTEHGLSGAAAEMGVKIPTLGYWLLRLAIQVKRVALSPGEVLQVNRGSDAQIL